MKKMTSDRHEDGKLIPPEAGDILDIVYCVKKRKKIHKSRIYVCTKGHTMELKMYVYIVMGKIWCSAIGYSYA